MSLHTLGQSGVMKASDLEWCPPRRGAGRPLRKLLWIAGEGVACGRPSKTKTSLDFNGNGMAFWWTYLIPSYPPPGLAIAEFIGPGGEVQSDHPKPLQKLRSDHQKNVIQRTKNKILRCDRGPDLKVAVPVLFVEGKPCN